MTNIQAADLLKGLEQCLDDYCELNDEGKTAFHMAIAALESFGISEQLPSVQPERKKGRWIVKEIGCKLTSYKCSECGRYITNDTGYDVKEDYPFCHCGADMRGEQDETD